MTHWVRFAHDRGEGFGTLGAGADPAGGTGTVQVHDGDMFGACEPTGESVDLADVELFTPCSPTKMIGVWNNFHAAAAKNGWSTPQHPLYFFKAPSCFLAPGGDIVPPPASDGRVVYEAELGVVIGTECSGASEDEARAAIFGYTCVNDVTAPRILDADDSFRQWCRAKSFDTFGPFGPAILVADGTDPSGWQVQTVLNGRVRQDYPVADMIFAPHRLVSLISQDMTLLPGDVVSCGTSLGAGPMRPGATVDIVIDEVGTLRNTFAAG